jgi:hypothetical protein
MKHSIQFILLAVVFFACNNTTNKLSDTTQPAQLPEIKVNDDTQGFGADISMHIQKIEKISSELSKYVIVSNYQNTPAGFILLLKKPEGKKDFIADGITFKPLGGDTSKNFIRALAEIYKLKEDHSLTFKDSLTIPYYDLAANVDTKDPSNWIAAQIKMFFETDDDTAELFLNIDEKNSTISFPEKDSSYRAGILTALSKKKQQIK